MDYSIQRDTYLGIPKCYKAQSVENLDAAGILPLLNAYPLSLDGQGVLILIPDEPGIHAERMHRIVQEAVPGAQVRVVELPDAPKELKDFFFIPEDVYVISEEDILALLDSYEEYEEPLVICFPLGSNNGSHQGDSVLSARLNQLALRPRNAVVVAMGNEAVNSHHFKGTMTSFLNPRKVEILVPDGLDGFYLELWTLPPERCEVTVQSPTGEISTRGTGFAPENITYTFLFEKTTVSIDYRDVGVSNREQLVFIRFIGPIGGIWTINVYPKFSLNGVFHIWLPMKGLLKKDVVFLEPDPENTLTMPSDSRSVISVGGFDAEKQTVFLESGRGFAVDGAVKPDFLAPCREDRFLGTSVAAGIAAGGAAIVLQWALERGESEAINSVDIKNFLIRGCTQREDVVYPNPVEGYGNLNVFDSFLLLK